jgi:hypothetical protein
MVIAASAWATEPTPSELQAARDLFAKAQKDEEAGDWSAALEKLRRVATVKMTPGVRLHIAVCEDKLGRLVAALADYTAAESLAKQQNNTEVLEAVSEPLAKMKVRVPMLTVTVPSDAQNVEVVLDGRKLAPGVIGVAMPIDPGPHRIEAKALGKKMFIATPSAKERDSITIDVRFEPAPMAVEQPGGSKVVLARLAQPSDETAPPPDDEPARGRSVVPAILTTTAAVGLGAFGIGAYAAADAAYGDLKTACAMSTTCPADKKDPVHAWDAVAISAWIGAGVVAGVAVVLWILETRPQETSARIKITPTGLRF